MAFIGQKLGRRAFIAIGGLLIIIGGSLQAGASGTAYLYAGRVIGGVGMGSFFSFVFFLRFSEIMNRIQLNHGPGLGRRNFQSR